MSYTAPIPARYIYSGEVPLAQEFHRHASMLLVQMREFMQRGEITEWGEPPNEGLDVHVDKRLYRGEFGSVEITGSISYGQAFIEIHAVPAGKEEAAQPPFVCPEYPCFIPARIVKVSCLDADISYGDDCEYEEKLRSGGRFFYDVKICYLDRVIVLENYNVTSAGWEVYQKGQNVVLGPSGYYTDFWDCCADEKPLAGELLNPETTKLQPGYLDAYPIIIDSERDGQIVKADWPAPGDSPENPDEYYKYLAALCISPSRLKKLCIREVVITGHSTSGSNIVNVYSQYAGDFFDNIPIIIHTDIGTRRRLLIDEDPASPEVFFDDAAFFFPVPAETYDTGIIRTERDNFFYFPNTVDTYEPTALALFENNAPIAVISIVRSVTKRRLSDPYKCLPTWKQLCATCFLDSRYEVINGDIYYESGENSFYSETTGKILSASTRSRWVLFDADGTAKIVNREGDALQDADAEKDNYVDGNKWTNFYIEGSTLFSFDYWLEMIVSSWLEYRDDTTYASPFDINFHFIEDQDYGFGPLPANANRYYYFDYNDLPYTLAREVGTDISVEIDNGTSPVFSYSCDPGSGDGDLVRSRGRELIYTIKSNFVEDGFFLAGSESVGSSGGSTEYQKYIYSESNLAPAESLLARYMAYISQVLTDYEGHEDNNGIYYIRESETELSGPYFRPDYLAISAVAIIYTPYDIRSCDLPYIP